MAFMDRVKQSAPDGLLDAEILLCDQFVEHVLDGSHRNSAAILSLQHMAYSSDCRAVFAWPVLSHIGLSWAS